MTALAKTGPGPSSAPDILLPGKITVKSAPSGRVLRMAQAPPLSVIFPGKTLGTYRKDGANRGPLSLVRAFLLTYREAATSIGTAACCACGG